MPFVVLWPSEPDDDHDGVQEKSENVAHAQDGIKRKKAKISWHSRNSPPEALTGYFITSVWSFGDDGFAPGGRCKAATLTRSNIRRVSLEHSQHVPL